MNIRIYVMMFSLLSMNIYTQHILLTPEQQMEFLHTLVEDLGGAEAIDASKEHAEYAKKMLTKVALDANVKDAFGFTPLMYAVLINSYTLTDHLLLQKDVDLAAQDKEGKTALMYAHEHKKELSQQHHDDDKVQKSDTNKLIIRMLEEKTIEQRKLNAAIEEEQSTLSTIVFKRAKIVSTKV